MPPQFPNNKLVFVQYLVGIAVVEACREVLGHAGDAVVLKWPNDIYAKVETPTGTELRKIGGILINTAFLGGGVRIIAGTYMFLTFIGTSYNTFCRMWIERS